MYSMDTGSYIAVEVLFVTLSVTRVRLSFVLPERILIMFVNMAPEVLHAFLLVISIVQALL